MKCLKITIVTVCYNAAEEIAKTMKSVLNQSFDDLEYIIIDGRSEDNTIAIIEQTLNKYKDKNVKLISEPDDGIFDAMNKGIRMATGEYVNFMNAGDTFYSNRTLDLIFNDDSIKSYDVIFGDQYLEGGRKKKMQPFIYKNGGYMNMGICHQCIFVRTRVAKKYLFDTSFKIAADYNMIYTLFSLGYKFKDTHIPVSIFDTNGYSAQNRLLQVDETARVCGVLGTWEHKGWVLFTQLKIFIKKLKR